MVNMLLTLFEVTTTGTSQKYFLVISYKNDYSKHIFLIFLHAVILGILSYLFVLDTKQKCS